VLYTSKMLSYVDDPKWPIAVLPAHFCDSQSDQVARARGIIENVFEKKIKGLDFLDFGCGSGLVSQQAINYDTKSSVGYDIVGSDSWSTFSHLVTDQWNQVSNKKFDVILICDVVDHSEQPMGEILQMASSVLRQNGHIYLRCHPWSSKHGTHVYKQLNRSFVHIMLNERESNILGLRHLPTWKLINPRETYVEIIQKSNLNIEYEHIVEEGVDDCFLREPFLSKFKIHWGERSIRENIRIHYIDYILTK
jgi:2-polyprenyl-3-methyl-5-hydroxy-6-metoxy-1,4-benzoquinol methylase